MNKRWGLFEADYSSWDVAQQKFGFWGGTQQLQPAKVPRTSMAG